MYIRSTVNSQLDPTLIKRVEIEFEYVFYGYLSKLIFIKGDLDSIHKYLRKRLGIWIMIVFDLDNPYPR